MRKSSITIPTSISALAARSRFGEIMRRASGKNRERFVVGRRGEPSVVIMGFEDFLNTIAPEPEVLAAIRAESVKGGSSNLTMAEINREIAAYRRERLRRNGKAGRRS
jgi:hypothetical protein